MGIFRVGLNSCSLWSESEVSPVSSSGVRQRESVGDPSLCGGGGRSWYVPHHSQSQQPRVHFHRHRDGVRSDLPSTRLRPLLQHLQCLRGFDGLTGGTGVKNPEWRPNIRAATSPTLPRMHFGGRRLCPVRSSEDHLHVVLLSSHLAVFLPGFCSLQQRPASGEVGRVWSEKPADSTIIITTNTIRWRQRTE